MTSITGKNPVWISHEENMYTRLKRRKYPELELPRHATIKPVLGKKQLHAFRSYFDTRVSIGIKSSGWKNRVHLFENTGTCKINKDGSVDVKFSKHTQIEPLKDIVSQGVKTIFKMDEDRACGSYRVEFFAMRDYGKHNDPLDITKSSLGPMHHDYTLRSVKEAQSWKGEIRSETPEYLFCSVLTDAKDEKHGWEGGHLIVQTDHSKNLHVDFDEQRPYLDYPYPANEGLCIRNKEAIHMRSGMKSTNAIRDLINVQFFKL